MANSTSSISSKMMKTKMIVGKLKNHFQLIHKYSSRFQAVVEFIETPRANDEEVVPNDVKEGYFAVFSVNPEEEPKRFVVELHWLTNPKFLNLLKQAEDEYGFVQKGVLEVPCRAEELQKILQHKIGRKISGFAV
ncbi:PREDICTED: auxin-responsive protein SAUR32-like [Nicotiana attenuata]|uniref:Auxin-responsive protein saur32 n=1 Tax=Nicotiana attenuata TaxID=49451 RepID=A0A1J6KK36_NICAT|nr:PREDICTED: auxin-responsive protein SAUR32-like [Nicotiana attenuata]OIT22143.1 auxin-responsive protein saur32 [Nicotiana attenuata]